MVIGEDEVARGSAQIKPLRGGGEQQACPFADLAGRLASLIGSAAVDGDGAARQDRGR